VDVLPVTVLAGVGAGLAFPSLMTLAMADATDSDSGLLSGLINTTQQVGGALGLAVLATLSTARTEDLLAGGDRDAAALTGGYQLAFGAGLVIVLAAIAVAAAVLPATPVAQPEELGAELLEASEAA
jgi:hypothetical protein